MPLEYLQKLSKAYEDFLEDISQLIPVLRVNWSTFHTAEDMAEQIRTQYASMRSIRRIDWEAPAAAEPAAPSTPVLPAAKPRFDAAEGSGALASAVDLADTATRMEDILDRAAARGVAAASSPTVGGESPQ